MSRNQIRKYLADEIFRNRRLRQQNLVTGARMAFLDPRDHGARDVRAPRNAVDGVIGGKTGIHGDARATRRRLIPSAVRVSGGSGWSADPGFRARSRSSWKCHLPVVAAAGFEGVDANSTCLAVSCAIRGLASCGRPLVRHKMLQSLGRRRNLATVMMQLRTSLFHFFLP
ncbi:hypothetical protein ACFOHS_10050 [Jhaorihella thermophila]